MVERETCGIAIMRFLVTLVGLVLMVFGIYYLGQNVVFGTPMGRFTWRTIAAQTSVLMLTGGIMGLVFLPLRSKNLAWGIIAAAIVVVFASGGVWLRPTTLWQFLMALISMTLGYRLMIDGQIRF